MTAQSEDTPTVRTALPSAELVAIYLRGHPEFFRDFPDVLHDLEISHASGDAVSLLERQIAGLRDENVRLKARFLEVVSLAKSNEDLIKRIHQLVLALMEAAGPKAIFALLGEKLAHEFAAEYVRTLVFAEPSFVEKDPQAEFVGRRSRERDLFVEILRTGRPYCGKLSDAQAHSLLSVGPRTGSAVVLPLSGRSWDGLIIIGSADEQRFNDEMGTEFLAYLGDIVSLVLDPWISRSEIS
jgi:uncharacterized protein YigA (DUF484 family)